MRQKSLDFQISPVAHKKISTYIKKPQLHETILEWTARIRREFPFHLPEMDSSQRSGHTKIATLLHSNSLKEFGAKNSKNFFI